MQYSRECSKSNRPSVIGHTPVQGVDHQHEQKISVHRRLPSKKVRTSSRYKMCHGRARDAMSDGPRSPDDIVDVVVDILGLQRDHGLGLLERYSGRSAEM
jgi:hypothetical protein